MSADPWAKFNLEYFTKAALAGGICCSVTHAAMCPVDVVKTRIQLDPIKYNKGLIGGVRQVIAEEGAGGLATGLAPTAIGLNLVALNSSRFSLPNPLESKNHGNTVMASTWLLLLLLNSLLMCFFALLKPPESVWSLSLPSPAVFLPLLPV